MTLRRRTLPIMGRARELGQRAWSWLTVAEAAPPARVEPRYVRPRMMFADGVYRPVDEVIREMWAGQGRATQEEALSVPGVLRARNLICSVATWPLVDLDESNVRHRNPLLTQIDPNVPNSVVIAQIIQDMLFEGVSWCYVLEVDTAGFPTKMEHLGSHRVTIQPIRYAAGMSPLPGDYTPREHGSPAQIMVDGEPADLSRIKRFDSPNPGVLKAAGATVKLAATYRKTALLYADNPRMDGYFHPTDGADPVEDGEVEELLSVWEQARRQHSTGYIPAALGYEKVENLSPADLQLVQLQDQATREVALALGLDPADLGVSTTTETYSNRIDKRIDRINDLLGPYVQAFNERMSMGDITRRGHRVWSDPNSFLRAAPKDRGEYYAVMMELGAMVTKDVCDGENLPFDPAVNIPPAQRALEQAPAGNVVPISRGQSRMAAGQGAAATFAAATQMHVHTEVVPFAGVDSMRRTISGVAVPYGPEHVGRQNGRRYRFAQGSIVWPDPRYVPILIDHVQSSSVGHFASITDGPAGTQVVARIAEGPEGDQALADAHPARSVRTGFSVGVDFNHEDCYPDPDQPGVWLVPYGKAVGKEISLVAVPSFQAARVASVTMSHEGAPMHCTTCGHDHDHAVACPPRTPAAQPAQPAQTFTAPTNPTPAPPPGPAPAPSPPGASYTPEQVQQMMAFAATLNRPADPGRPAEPGPERVDPTRGAPQHGQPAPAGDTFMFGAGMGPNTVRPAAVTEAAPYRFNHEGELTAGPQYDLSRDLIAGVRDGDMEAKRRVLGFMREMTVGGRYGMRPHARFADVDRADVAGLNPNRQRPDMYVPQRQYEYPLTAATRRGTLTDSTAFTLPKFASAAGLTGPHTEGVEPTGGSFVVTTQTITPTPRSGALDMTREAWDQGGNPQATALIWRQFEQSWYEALESGVATFLATLTAATDIALTAGAVNGALALEWRGAVARLNFARGGQAFDFMGTEQELYVALATAQTTGGEPIFPQINPTNRDGTSRPRYTSVTAAGITATPSWALASVAGSVNSSWLFDSSVVHTWDTGPQRLEFAGIDASGNYAPIAYVRLGVWGYQALANTDISGVREVKYDTTV